jgi:hypothetical protein
MKRIWLGIIAVAVAATFLSPPVGAGAQEVLQATIEPGPFLPTDTPLIESTDVCNRGASSPQINVVVTAPNGVVVIDQWHLVGTQEPGVVVDTAGNWSVELQLRDDLGQPTGEPFPALGTYTVRVDCVTTYLPRVRIPYNGLTFDVVDGTTTPTVPAGGGDSAVSPSAGDAPVGVAPVAVPVRTDPTYTG